MSQSVETVIQKGDDLVTMLMLTDDKLLAAQLSQQAVNDFVDSLYDYLADPDTSEIAELQNELAPMAAILPQLVQQQQTKAQSQIPAGGEEIITGFMRDFTKYSSKMSTPRMAEAFKRASGGTTLEDHAQVQSARIQHATDTKTLHELMMMNSASTNKMATELVTNALQFVTSEKLVKFMTLLPQKLDKDDTKAALGYVVDSGLEVADSIFSLIDDIEDNADTIFANRNPSELEIAAYMQEKKVGNVLKSVFNKLTPTKSGAQRVKRIYTAVEESLLESGALTEESYMAFLESANTRSLKNIKGYDAMNGFNAKKALGAPKKP